MTQDVDTVEDLAEKAELSAEQKRARRRGLALKAIALAGQGNWEEALTTNERILGWFPDDPEAHNRIGNALSQLNRIPDAIAAYEQAVVAQPTNVIAQRNLSRLRRILEAGETTGSPSQKLQSSFFIEEVGKTGVTALQNVADPASIARITAGDEVKLEQRDAALVVTTLDSTPLGSVATDLGERLIRLMNGGNQYQAGVVMAEPGRVRILVRETYQSPEQEGRISFPPKTAPDVRAYTRTSLLRRSGEDEDEIESDATELEPDELEDEDENPSEFGFSETSLSDSDGA